MQKSTTGKKKKKTPLEKEVEVLEEEENFLKKVRAIQDESDSDSD